jgi:hypothetical protein
VEIVQLLLLVMDVGKLCPRPLLPMSPTPFAMTPSMPLFNLDNRSAGMPLALEVLP